MLYEVTLTQKEIYSITIEAKDEQEAEDLAIDLYEKEKEKYHYDSDMDIEVEESRDY